MSVVDAYQRGHVSFMGLDLVIAPGALVPREETELLGQSAVSLLNELEHEPREAFAADPYGLSIHQRVIKEALGFLKPGGTLLFEFGLGQDRRLKLLFDRAKQYEDVRFAHNQAGEARVVLGRKKQA